MVIWFSCCLFYLVMIMIEGVNLGGINQDKKLSEELVM